MTKIKAVKEDENVILRGVKLRLFTTEEDEEFIYTMSRDRELVYNWAIDKLWENYNSYKDHMEDYRVLTYESMTTMFTEYRNSDNCDPNIKEFHTGPARVAIKDAIKSFRRLKSQIPLGKMKPRYHKTSINRFNQGATLGLRGDKSYILDGKLYTENIDNLPRLCIELITHKFDGYGGNGMGSGKFTKYWYNPRIVKDTDGFYLCFSIPKSRKSLDDKPWTEPIGIDLGCRTTFQLSTEEFFNQPDVSKERDHISKVNSEISRLYKFRKRKAKKLSVHVWDIPKSKHELILIDRRNKSLKRIHNKLEYFYYQVINDIVKRRPEAIVLETIYVRDLFRLHQSAKGIRRDISQVYFCMIRYMFEAKCDEYSIPLYEVRNDYPSSLICNRCKHHNSELGSNKTFVCPVCGYTVDRDLNASLNLRDVYVNKEVDNIKWWNGHGNKLVLKDKTTHI